MASLGIDILGDFGTDRRRIDGRRIFIFAAVFSIFAPLCLYTINLGVTGQGGRNRAVPAASAQILRADIVDRNGEILAKNIYSFDAVMNARQIKNADRAAAFVHSVFPDISVNDVLEKIGTGKGRIEIKKDIGRETAAVIRDEKIDGLTAVPKQVRKYPRGNSTSHIVGFVGKDDEGIEGIELFANERLKNVPDPLVLSIDARIQSVMWADLSAAMKEYKARAAIGALMNARTGEILAAVSIPDYDPENINSSPGGNRTSRFRFYNYEMGSIFKIFNTALALSHGMPTTKTFNVVDPFVIAGKPVGEARGFRPPAKNLNVAQIMQYSSNSGSAQIALSLPDGAQADFFRELFFDRPIDTDFGTTEKTGFPGSFTPTDRSRWSFGQGISVTPLHALLAANAIVNDGKYIMPTIYRRDFVPNTRQVVSKDVSKRVRQIMLKVMDTSGRAAATQIRGMNIGGKTSTAQKFIDGKYSDTKNITAFFAAFPIEAPKWSMLIMMDEVETFPRTAAHNVVPVAGKIMNAIIQMLQQ